MGKLACSSIIAVGVVVVPALVGRDGATAVETVTHIESAPCGWFSNLYQ